MLKDSEFLGEFFGPMWNLPDDKWTNEYDDEAETLVKSV